MTTLALIFATVTTTLHLPQGLLSAVCYVESAHKPQALNPNDGGEDSIGLCQIKLSTAKMLGFKGTAKELHDPFVNAYYAGRYLKKQLERYDNFIPHAVAAYNAGKLYLNSKNHVTNRKYVDKVFRSWVDGR
jgi:soluble lytic murein transglycosylase-like protein